MDALLASICIASLPNVHLAVVASMTFVDLSAWSAKILAGVVLLLLLLSIIRRSDKKDFR